VAVLAKPRQFPPVICGREEKTIEHRKEDKRAREQDVIQDERYSRSYWQHFVEE